MGTVFAEMSFRTALPWYKVMKTAFLTKNIKNVSFGILIMKILNNNKELIKLGFSAFVVLEAIRKML